MSRHPRLEELIPFYVNGTLSADEQEQVESFLAGSAEGRADLAAARLQLDLAALGAPDSPGEPVHPLLLVQYAEDPQQLDGETLSFVERRLAESALSRDALDRLREVAEPQAQASSTLRVLRNAAKGFWLRLRESVLQPVPALAYLVLLAVIVPVWLSREGELPQAPPVGSARVLSSRSEPVVRDLGDQPEPIPPLLVPPAVDAHMTVLLRLETDLDPADLDRPGTRYELLLLRGAELVWSEPRAPAEFVIDGEQVSLPVLLFPARLAAGEPYRLEIRVDRPGDPLHGQALFTRRFVVQ